MIGENNIWQDSEKMFRQFSLDVKFVEFSPEDTRYPLHKGSGGGLPMDLTRNFILKVAMGHWLQLSSVYFYSHQILCLPHRVTLWLLCTLVWLKSLPKFFNCIDIVIADLFAKICFDLDQKHQRYRVA